jgi:hypothetical protein
MYNRGASPAQIASYIDRSEANNLRAIIMEPNQPAPEYPGIIRGTTQQVLRGATFGFSDEALGSLAGLLSPSLTMQEGRDLMRGEQRAFQEQHPKGSLAANLAGGVAGAGAAPGMATLGAGGRLAAAGVGAVMGAIAGAGEAEGGLSERSKSALLGAGIGAVAGPVIGGAVNVAARATGAIVSRAVPEAFRKRVSGLMASIPGTPQRAALTALTEGLDADGVTPAIAAARVAQRTALGTPTTVADVAGDHTLAVIETAQSFKTPEQQAFASRIVTGAIQSGERLLDALGAGTRVGLQNVHELARRVIQRRADVSAPLYEVAHSQTVRLGTKTKSLLNQPLWRESYEMGRQVSIQEKSGGIAVGLDIPALPKAIPDVLPVKAIDYMKQGLDVIIERAGTEGRPSMSTRTARALRAQLGLALDEVDAAVPIFRQARATWAGYSQPLDELKAGMEDFSTSTPAAIAARLKNSPDPEMYRIGAVSSIADAVHGARATAKDAERFFGANLFGAQDRTQLARIQALFDSPAAAQEFADRVASEATLAYPASRLGPRGTPNPRSATQRLSGGRRVRRFAEQHGLAAPQQDRARQVANEITRFVALGLDDPQGLIVALRTIPIMRQTAARSVGAIRTTAAATGARAQTERQRQTP